MSGTVPNHLGIILDGNRRWAKEHGLPKLDGHRQGVEVLRESALYAFERGIKYVTAFVFSTENWKRTDEEVGYLMNLIVSAVEDYLETFHKEGVRIVVLGRRDGLRRRVLRAITKAEDATKNNIEGTLALCINYGGKEEIVDAVKRIAQTTGNLQDLTADELDAALYYPEVPDIDLIVRTSGEQRLSGFMLWRSAYSELYFCDKYWPAFTKRDMDKALDLYQKRERRFGT